LSHNLILCLTLWSYLCSRLGGLQIVIYPKLSYRHSSIKVFLPNWQVPGTSTDRMTL